MGTKTRKGGWLGLILRNRSRRLAPSVGSFFCPHMGPVICGPFFLYNKQEQLLLLEEAFPCLSSKGMLGLLWIFRGASSQHVYSFPWCWGKNVSGTWTPKLLSAVQGSEGEVGRWRVYGEGRSQLQ